MTIELAFGLLGAITGLIALGREAVKAHRARSESDTRTTREALKIIKQTREDTGRHIAQWADCEERFRELSKLCARLEDRLNEAEAENNILRKRVGELEQEVAKLRAGAPLARELSRRKGLSKIK